MSEIRSEKEELVQKKQYLMNRLESFRRLIHRSECPCCEQRIDYHFYESKIPDLELKLQEIDKRLDEIIPIIIKLNKEKALEDEKRYKEHKQEINEYIIQNKNRLNKAIRDYYKGIENYMPDLPDEEKSIWNEAMEWHLDNRNLDENEELYFVIN